MCMVLHVADLTPLLTSFLVEIKQNIVNIISSVLLTKYHYYLLHPINNPIVHNDLTAIDWPSFISVY